MTKPRCSWAGPDEIYIKYHDEEWGIPTHDDTVLFEMLVLESFQAGLSWITILKKRENFNIMIEDGIAGKFNLIITKEITRPI